MLEQKGCTVLLTRDSDATIGLDGRTSYANDNATDALISIHANYASSQARGVETFYMQSSLLKEHFSQLSGEQRFGVERVVKQRSDESYALASAVQRTVCNNIISFHDEPIDRKVKCSVSQVLLGTQSPAILVEVGFLSHPKESALLHDAHYQNCIAQGICNGILSAFSL
jgi:N-acetylmuramoyl-L-alanine amidase